MEPLDFVDPRLPVCAVKRDVNVAADCGCPVGFSCALAPCCRSHRQWVLFSHRQRALQSALAERRARERCIRLWELVARDFEELPSRRRPNRGKFRALLSSAKSVFLMPAGLDALGELPFAALWRGMLHLRDSRLPFRFQAWLRSQQLSRDREVVAEREQRHGACACLVFLCIRCGLARLSLCARR